MPTALQPDAVPADAAVTDPQAVAEAFLEALAASDLERAMGYMTDDVVYTNVGLPTIRGRNRV
ncbi:MAG TPA: limonene-1,2-epoxide hydrolase family protein, partial [Microthrixaceae bacterium]|nr:limonene-1,2-epoxide hydrolase family protein [Microthrixaceae bacterium]